MKTKNEDNSSNKNYHDVIPLNNVDSFSTADNVILLFLHLESLIEIFFSWVELCFEIKAGSISFSLVCKISRAILGIFSQTFSNHLFVMDNLFLLSYIYL